MADASGGMERNGASIFDLCPLCLLCMLAPLAIAELDVGRFGLTPPHQVLPPFRILIDLLVFGVPFAWAAQPRTFRGLGNVLAAAMILPLGNAIMPYALGLTVHLLPAVFDRQVIALDATLGAQASFLVAEAFARLPLLHSLCSAMYEAIIFPVALVAAMEAQRRRRTGIGMLPTFLVVAGIGYGCYALMPVIGPDAWFGAAFPGDIGLSRGVMPRNCMPSLHNTWVILAFLLSRGMSTPIRAVAGAWVIGTMVATLGLGEHYLLDIVVAMPFVLLIRALCDSDLAWSSVERRSALLVGLLLLLAWVLPVRGVVEPQVVPGLVPAAMLATVSIAIWWERRLARATGSIALRGGNCLAQPATRGSAAAR